MVERFNGRITEFLVTTRFKDLVELSKTLKHYLKLYNHWIPQKALGNMTPIDALEKMAEKETGTL